MPYPAQPFILIVDDNATNLSVLSQVLKAAGYKVRMAVDGEDALAQVERNHPELILLDVDMPKMDGFETCLHLQKNPITQGIPIIFMTALADTEHKVKGLSLGAVDYITKPFAEAEVLARVKVHWGLKRLMEFLEQQVVEQIKKLQQAQLTIVQSEKMSALGNLVAGVAHEMNNPLGFISASLKQAKPTFTDIVEHLKLYQKRTSNSDEEISKHAESIDLDYSLEDFPKMLDAMVLACDRLENISTSLRTFSRADKEYKVPFNIHEGIDSTILILKHRLKANDQRPAIEIVTDYGNLPQLECFSGQLNQVFMNILANAIDALDESNTGRNFADIKDNPNKITIKTSMADNHVKISIADNGKGMIEEVKQKIFDHLFTTKGVGKGTGLGLAIARQIVMEKHGGNIEVNSTVGKGTEFIIKIPV
ncbi:hybrid sensor histidine kinase/response regulator [Calothrix sp. PCC 6303]|uniref:hybrid sensor histidine kinase/response regulator n=1 Tax=Calothrix sp. PCC 6303 TaxID=1170562 RepID=UPI0002A01755|nr:hybrid sensor histidine kinase/response regulator [Calothrix sp. PCC 6303]AFZ03093.1 response regulator receiver sensor signal transduction histidine kinase [Calothrix sp. PCC 6303]